MTSGSLALDRPSGMCRLCGTTTRQSRITREEMAGLGQWLWECGHCRALYLDPDLSPAGIRQFYARLYRRLYPFEVCHHPDEAFLAAIRCREVGWRRARALADVPPSGGRVLEIGSGHGGFLGCMHRFRPDLSLSAVEPDLSHRTLALNGAPVSFLEWGDVAMEAPFHLIVLFHALEHVLDPVRDLEQLRAALAQDGRVVIEVPETQPHALSHTDIHPAHTTYFTAATLYRTCKAAGLSPMSPHAAKAALPGCLWVEANAGEDAVDAPADSPPARIPSGWARPTHKIRRILTTLVPEGARGALSRWKHGPVLDAMLSEPQGRFFRWGIGFDPLSMTTVLDVADQAMTTRQLFRVADVNVAKLMGLRRDAAFRMAVLSADACLVDGMGVVWGLKALGANIPEKVSGIDLLEQAMALCAERGFRPFILGATADVVERAAKILLRKYPGLQMAGWRHGYFSPEEDDEVAGALAASGADCLVVALPYPRQDIFLARIHSTSRIPFAFGVGGALDVVAGDRQRAPTWMQRHGLEWAFRLVQEPRRLGPRYLSSNARYFFMLLSYLAARRFLRPPSS